MSKGTTDKSGKESSPNCPQCGKPVVGPAASPAGDLGQGSTCRCDRDEKFDSVSMSQRFWKLKKEEKSGFKTTPPAGVPGSKLIHVDLVEGAVIGGIYQIIKLIGRGGMGEVYLTMHLTLGKLCALKVIPPEQVTAVGWQRFQTEARLFAKLDHLNLVRVSDLGIHDGCLPFYAMDFVDGVTLSDWLAKNGPLSVSMAVEVFKQVCDGVDFAHRNGIIHREFKAGQYYVCPGSKCRSEI